MLSDAERLADFWSHEAFDEVVRALFGLDGVTVQSNDRICLLQAAEQSGDNGQPSAVQKIPAVKLEVICRPDQIGPLYQAVRTAIGSRQHPDVLFAVLNPFATQLLSQVQLETADAID